MNVKSQVIQKIIWARANPIKQFDGNLIKIDVKQSNIQIFPSILMQLSFKFSSKVDIRLTLSSSTRGQLIYLFLVSRFREKFVFSVRPNSRSKRRCAQMELEDIWPQCDLKLKKKI